MKRLRLQYRIALATFLPLTLFALASIGLGAYALTVIPRGIVLERQAALSQLAAAAVAGNLQSHQRLLESVAGELAAASGDMSRQQGTLAERAGSLAAFGGGVRLLDRRGTVLAATPSARDALGQNLTSRGYLLPVIAGGGAVFTTLPQGADGEPPRIAVAVPLRRKGTIEGALAGEINLQQDDWAPGLALLGAGQEGRAYLIDSAGTILFHPQRWRVGQSVQGDVALSSLARDRRARSILYRPAGTREQVVAALAPLPGVPWALIVEEPWRPILATIAPYRWTVAGLMLAGLGLSLLLLFASLRGVTRPLTALVAAGQGVAEGQPFRPLAEEGPPDLRVLMRAVNGMVARLAEQRAALRRYARQVLVSQEEERRRLSRDLHDETVQDLVALTQRLELCANALETDPVAARQRLAELQRMAQQTLSEVRRLSNSLRPAALEDLGLPSAVQMLTDDLARDLAGAQVHCEVVGRQEPLPADLDLVVYRVCQEALNNVRKHAATAEHVNVALFYETWGIMLMVEDDGPGFQPPHDGLPDADSDLGLMGMYERAAQVSGQLHIISEPGQGTTVTLRVPKPLAVQPSPGEASESGL